MRVAPTLPQGSVPIGRRRRAESCAWASIGLPQSPQWCRPSGARKRRRERAAADAGCVALLLPRRSAAAVLLGATRTVKKIPEKADTEGSFSRQSWAVRSPKKPTPVFSPIDSCIVAQTAVSKTNNKFQCHQLVYRVQGH